MLEKLKNKRRKSGDYSYSQSTFTKVYTTNDKGEKSSINASD
jgi:hypothetical protein